MPQIHAIRRWSPADLKAIAAQTNHPDIGDSDFGVWTNDDWILKDMDVPTPPRGAQPTENYWRPDGWELGQSRVLDAEVLENVQMLFQKSIDTKLKEANAGQIGFTPVLNSGKGPLDL